MSDHFWHLSVAVACSVVTGAMFAKGLYVLFAIFLVGTVANAMSCCYAYDDKEG